MSIKARSGELTPGERPDPVSIQSPSSLHASRDPSRDPPHAGPPSAAPPHPLRDARRQGDGKTPGFGPLTLSTS